MTPLSSRVAQACKPSGGISAVGWYTGHGGLDFVVLRLVLPIPSCGVDPCGLGEGSNHMVLKEEGNA